MWLSNRSKNRCLYFANGKARRRDEEARTLEDEREAALRSFITCDRIVGWARFS